MDEKTELIRQIKLLPEDPIAVKNGHELVRMMDYYGVNNLNVLTVEQCHKYWLGRVIEMIFEERPK